MLPDVSIELKWKGQRYRDVDRGLRAFGDDLSATTERFKPVARRVLRDYMRGVVKSVHDRVTTPYPSGTSAKGMFPGTLSKRSGRLAASLNDSLIKVTDEPEVSFTLSGIAVVHERGATIRAKNAQYLTIPLPAALNTNGTPKRPTARSWPNTFIIKSKKGNLLIMQKKGTGMVPLYVLKKSVRIPKRLAFQEAFEAGTDFLADKLAQELLREFNAG